MRKLFFVTLILLVATLSWLVYREWSAQRKRQPAPTPETGVLREFTPETDSTRAEPVVVPAIASERRIAEPAAVEPEPASTAPAAAEPETPPLAAVKPKVSDLLAQADALTGTDAAAVRLAYIEVLRAGYTGPREKEIKDRLSKLNDQILFSPEPCPEAVIYTVTADDHAGLGAIARRFDSTHELIMKINRKPSTVIRPGERLKIIPGPFDVVVRKGQFALEVYLKGAFVKHYRIGLGVNNSTPVGEYHVTSKLIKPSWFRPGGEVPYGDPENPLGTRWIGFFNEYGIHGTWEPETIGREGSRGCVRMLNAEVEELFDLLVTGKSRITIVQ